MYETTLFFSFDLMNWLMFLKKNHNAKNLNNLVDFF